MAYDRRLETVLGAKAVYDESQKAAAAARMKTVKAKQKAKKAAKKEGQA